MGNDPPPELNDENSKISEKVHKRKSKRVKKYD